MKLNLNFEYDKLHLKEVVILIPKYHPNMVSFLTPVLGLYGINVKEFINEFNTKTRFVKFDIIVPVRVRISKIKTFEIFIRTPYVSSIVSNLPSFVSSNSRLNLLSIYKISLIKSVFNNFFMAPFQEKTYRSLRQYLSVISSSNSSIRLKASTASEGSLFLSYLFNFKLWSKIFNVLDVIKALPYGVFLTFNSFNSNRINYLVNSLGLVGLHIKKVPSALFSVFLHHYRLYGNVYYIGSEHFSKFTYLASLLLNRKSNPGLFVNYFKFNKNLFSLGFLQLFTHSYSKIANPVTLTKIIYILNTNLIKLLSKNSLKVIRLLKFNHANLSSNIT